MRPLLVLLLLPLAAVAAPVPKDAKAAVEKKFGGKVVDPKGDSTFELDGDALKITLPAGEERRFGYTEDPADPKDFKKFKKFNHTPRVEFTQTGDFTLTVRVSSPLTEGAKAVGPEGNLHVGGGLQIVPKDGGWYRYGMVQEPKSRSREVCTCFPLDSPRQWTNGLAGATSNKMLDNPTIWLRVVRSGKDAWYKASVDGKEWEQTGGVIGAFPDDAVTLALYAEHCSDTKHTVTFDQFKLETPKK